MGKSVYLFELDSVRKTDGEVAIAQRALYDEIINNGNRVILSYNQLTDSRLIASMLQGDRKSGNRSIQQMLELFNRGWLAFSRYGDARTPSQYLQNSIRKNLEPSEAKFVYSGLPLKSTERRLMRLTLDALQNADASVFTEFIDPSTSRTANAHEEPKGPDSLLALFAEYKRKGNEYVETPADISASEARERLILLKTYVQFILALSLDETTANPTARHQPETMNAYRLCNLIKIACSIRPPEGLETTWREAVAFLQPNGGLPDSVLKSENRSDWLEGIKKLDANASGNSSLCMAALIVNLCYNYIVEYSIFGTSKHYDASAFVAEEYESFADDFRSRVEKDWKDCVGATSRFLPDEAAPHKHFDVDVKRWERGLRILRRRKAQPSTFLNVDPKTTVYTQLRNSDSELASGKATADRSISMYEDGREQQRNMQLRDNNKRLWVSLVVTAATLVLVYALNWIQGFFEDLSSFNVIVTSLVLFVGFALIERLIKRIVPESDIWTNFINIFRGIGDLARNSKHEIESYFNRHNNGTAKEALPNFDDPLYAQTPQMKRYDTLRKERADLFESEEPQEIEILGIGTGDTIEGRPAAEYARDYETRTGVSLGVCYESQYHLLVVDLVRWKNTGAIGAYERVVPSAPNAGVVIAPKYKGKWVLMKQFRHALRKYQLCFPRGFGELDSNGEPLPDDQNALKELREELDASVLGKPVVIGDVAPDSGILAKTVKICFAEIEAVDETSREEGICDFVLMNDDEVANAIRNRDIEDGYTLSAFAHASVM
ncbi:MAG: hypothetical protein IJ087_22045 [Eggerthellaceae bacterium]|nr:hypothetical protein [Eggerthellaceae bacterium]